jgi:hypothetical protein
MISLMAGGRAKVEGTFKDDSPVRMNDNKEPTTLAKEPQA